MNRAPQDKQSGPRPLYLRLPILFHVRGFRVSGLDRTWPRAGHRLTLQAGAVYSVVHSWWVNSTRYLCETKEKSFTEVFARLQIYAK